MVGVVGLGSEEPMARPSDYNQEIADAVCELLGHGVPLARIAAMDGMPSYSTLKKWQRDNSEFSALSSRAREDGTHFLGEDSLRIADDLEIDPQHKKIMIDTRLRLIGKWNAKAYGDKMETVHSGSIDVMTKEQRDAAVAAAALANS